MSASHARGTTTAPVPAPERRGVVTGTERAELAVSLGVLLRAERHAHGWTHAQLAQRAGMARCTVERLERGVQRPSVGTTWRLARALRPNSSLRDQVALDLRLQLAAGRSLRRFSHRTNRRRERLAAELLAEHEIPMSESDDLASVALSMLATGKLDA